jgi:pimeloyl-ACP methyl ester carboxylesterase
MKLNHQVVGSGPPLLILHGLLGSLDNWMPVAQELAAHFQVFRLDLRNHGRSPHAAEFNYEVMAADLAEFIRDQNLSSVHLLGHSMGGKVAMRFAQLHPDAVTKLVVVDMSPREYPPRYDGLLDAMLALDLSTFRHRSEVDVALAAAVPDKTIRQFLLKNLDRDAAGLLFWKPNLAAIRANYHRVREALPTTPPFPGPTLFVRGGVSDYISSADFGLIHQMFPNAEMQTIASAGHWVHAEAPAEFPRIVSRFLSE